MRPIIIQLKKEDYLKCIKFSNECINTTHSHLMNRGQSDKDKMILDHAIGKFAELGTYEFFKNKLKLVCTEPDFNIYKKQNKSFDPDIIVGNFNIHVKSCQQNSYYPGSWIFQYSGIGSGHTDPVLNGNDINNYISLCFVDKTKYVVKIAGIINANFCKEKNLYKLPKKEVLQKTKRAIYDDDLQKFDKEVLWSFVIQAEKAGLLNKS